MWDEEGLLGQRGGAPPVPSPRKSRLRGPLGTVGDSRAPLDPGLVGSFLRDQGLGRGRLWVSPSLPCPRCPCWKLSVLTPRGQGEEQTVKVPSAVICWGLVGTGRCSEHTHALHHPHNTPKVLLCTGSLSLDTVTSGKVRGHWAASPAPTRSVPGAAPAVTTRNVSRCDQVSPGGLLGRDDPA